MNKLMKRLSRSSFRQSSTNLNHRVTEMTDSNNINNKDSPMIDFDGPIVSASHSAQPSTPTFPQLPPPPPPRPPPRRKRRQTSVFYSSALPLLTTYIDDKENTREQRPVIPPPIPPRSSSIDEYSVKDKILDNNARHEKLSTSSDNSLFSTDELIENLIQNLNVMEELNYSLRSELKQCRNENANLINELAAINIERDQLLQTCKEIDQLKENEWLCSICLDDRNLIVSTSRQIVSTFCGHLFCNNCVNMALDIENVCPTCRKPIPQKRPAFHFLYF